LMEEKQHPTVSFTELRAELHWREQLET